MVNTTHARTLAASNINDNQAAEVTPADVRSVIAATLDAIDRIDNSSNILDYGAKLDGVTDDTDAWNQALWENKIIYFPEGRSVISDKLNFPFYEGVSIVGAGRNKSVLIINAFFNMTAQAVIQFNGAYQGLKDISLEFIQASTATRSAVKKYPVAIDLNGHSRAELSSLRISSGYEGIRAVGNCGGALIDDIQIGCFKRGLFIDGALDSIRINRYHFWPFGIAQDADLFSIYGDGTTVSMEIGRCDDLNISSILSFQARIIFGDYGLGGPFGVGSNITLDSNYGRLEFNGGEMTLSCVYGSSAVDNDFIIRQTGGELRISGLAMESADLGDNPMVRVSGGDSVFICSDFQATIISPMTQAFRLESGIMMLSNGYFNAAPNQERIVSLINIVGGRATLNGLRTRDKGTGAGVFISVSQDDWHVIANNSCPGYTYAFPTSKVNGIYSPNRPAT